MEFVSNPLFDDNEKMNAMFDVDDGVDYHNLRVACNSYLVNYKKSKNKKSPKITPEFQQTLFLKYNYAKKMHNNQDQRRDWTAILEQEKEKLVLVNSGYVYYMFNFLHYYQYPDKHSQMSEIISDWFVVLLRCIEKFNVEHGARFGSYLRNAIIKNEIKKQTNKFIKQSSTKNIADFSVIDTETLVKMGKFTSETPEKIAINNEIIEKVQVCLNSLSGAERLLLQERYYNCCSYNEIGQKLVENGYADIVMHPHMVKLYHDKVLRKVKILYLNPLFRKDVKC